MMEMEEPSEEKSNPPESDGKQPSSGGLKQIRTFQGDVADALGSQKESLFSIQQQEVMRSRAAGIAEGPTPAELETKKRRSDFIFLLIGSAFFIVVGTLGAWFGYREYVRRTAPPVALVPESRLIAVSEETAINISGMTREAFGAAFAAAVSGVGPGRVKHVVLKTGAKETETFVTTAEFMNLLESRAPGALVRSFDKIFMLGAIGGNTFMIVRLASFENAFAGMLSWEPSMAGDLLPIFPQNDALKATAPASVFKDVVVRNKDVRVLSVGEGTSTRDVLFYSFFDNNMLVVTDGLEAFQTLMERLTREKLSR